MARAARISYDEAQELLGHARRLLSRKPKTARELLQQVAAGIRRPPRLYRELVARAGLEPPPTTQ